MTIIKFSNQHNPDEIWSKDALDSNVGKELPLTNTATGETGVAKVLAVEVDDKGITVTYETDMNFGIRMDHFHVETPYLEEDDPMELYKGHSDFGDPNDDIRYDRPGRDDD